ncbi:hypothetical protein KIW84_065916 [Lathyrus oleraceus]|uniref:Protein FAR1-RELATED SEQUENCE n=1 Tax=Pisum sativum TaxID=3888 RepID=A0A9D4WFL3_PEA|nr:hypothetical protein KIW84_065916 [Pisum sativum]
MVDRFGLEESNWINELYQKSKMWEITHIWGDFFARIRTTSRCEAFHSHMGQFVHSKMNITDFLKQLYRCVAYFRFREVQANFQSQYGQTMLHTSLRVLERSASKQWTKKNIRDGTICYEKGILNICIRYSRYGVLYNLCNHKITRRRTWMTCFPLSIE